MRDVPLEHYPENRPRTATIRSRVVLEVASELAGSARWEPKQALVRLRRQGAADWALTFFGSDSYRVMDDVAAGAVHLAIVNPATAAGPALHGAPPFASPIPLRAIATIPSFDQLGIAVHERTGIVRLEELASRTEPLQISLRGGRPDHSVHMVVGHLLDALGTSPEDLADRGHELRYDDDIPHRGDRGTRVADAQPDVVCDEGVYNWVDMAIGAGYRFLAIPGPILSRLESIGYRRSSIESRRHERLDTDVATLDFSGFLVYTHRDVDDDVVADFCRALHARRDRIPWQGGATLPLERMVVDAPDAPIPIPFHPAAQRVWEELGLLEGEA